MEKKRLPSSDADHESDKQFLERMGVGLMVKEVLTKLIENRPEDPILFLADYFETVGDKVDRVSKAHQQINLTHYSKPAFQNNVRHAYEILGHSRVTKTVRGFNGGIYTELLNLLCKDFPATVKDHLFRKIQCRDHEVVLFDIFKSGVFTCVVLKDFIEQSGNLYKLLDAHDADRADKIVCDALLQHFKEAVSKTSSDPESILDAGYMLSTEKTFSAIGSAMFKSSGTGARGHMSCDDFIAGMVDCFLLKVQPLR